MAGEPMTPQTGPIVKWEQDHIEGCAGLRNTKDGTWGSPWFYTGQMECRRDALGRHHPHGTHRWLVLICNDPSCSARVLVQEFSLFDLVPSERVSA